VEVTEEGAVRGRGSK